MDIGLNMGDLRLPVYYVVNRTLPQELAVAILRALSYTPVHCAVISDVLDAEFALSLCTEVILAKSEADSVSVALAIQEQTTYPVLIIGTADVLDAVFVDGKREKVGSVA